jgi:hypothetical protein
VSAERRERLTELHAERMRAWLGDAWSWGPHDDEVIGMAELCLDSPLGPPVAINAHVQEEVGMCTACDTAMLWRIYEEEVDDGAGRVDVG